MAVRAAALLHVADGGVGGHARQVAGPADVADGQPRQLQRAGQLRGGPRVEGTGLGGVLTSCRRSSGFCSSRPRRPGSTPARRTRAFAASLSSSSTGRNTLVNAAHREREQQSRTARGGRSPTTSGAISPTTRCRNVTTNSASAKAGASAARRGSPSPSNAGVEPVVDGGFADRAQRQGAGGDAELGAGQQHRQLGGAAQRRPARRRCRRRPPAGAASRRAGRTRRRRRTRSSATIEDRHGDDDERVISSPPRRRPSDRPRRRAVEAVPAAPAAGTCRSTLRTRTSSAPGGSSSARPRPGRRAVRAAVVARGRAGRRARR